MHTDVFSTRPFEIVLLFLLLLAAAKLDRVQAQITINLTGRVTDATTKQSLPFATVYLDATQIGTTTDEQGRFQLTGVRLGTVELVASYLGYATNRLTLRLENAQPQEIHLVLTPNTQLLAGVTVRAKKDADWQRKFSRFERELLGSFSGDCRIENPDVIQLTENQQHLLATAAQPLRIVNNELGYRLIYDLQHFDTFQGTTFYGGTSRFEALTPGTPRKARQWAKNRLRAYYGSLRHLLASLVSGSYEAEGFLVYGTDPNQPIFSTPPLLSEEINKHLKRFDAHQAIQPGTLSTERWLRSKLPLTIFYTKQRVQNPLYRDAPYGYAQLLLPHGYMGITTSGLVSASKGYSVSGYLQSNRLGSELPTDWQPSDYPPSDKPDNKNRFMPKGQALPIDSTLTRLAEGWSRQHIRQSPGVFVHVDKPICVAGDTLWLSGYLPDARTHQLNASGAEPGLQVDLWSATNELIRHQWLRVENSRATGYLALDDSLTTGVYRLLAYTESDKQNGRAAFERRIVVLNEVEHKQQLLHPATHRDTVVVQCLPEGGHWVTGLPAQLGIKAVAKDGHGRPISGRVLTDTGQELLRFTTSRRGMGSFRIPAAPDKRHPIRLELTADSAFTTYHLPAPDTAGFVLSVALSPDSSQLQLSAFVSPGYANQRVYFIVQGRGVIDYQTKYQLDGQQAQVAVSTALLQPGLTQVALADVDGQIRAERLVYVPPFIRPHQLIIKAGQPSYKIGERVEVTLTLLSGEGNPDNGELSVAVTDVDRLPPDTAAASIRTHLLLTGDLRGYVDSPEEYFDARQPDRAKAIDDLLLTQGWRRLDWQTLPKPVSIADTLGGIVLRGRITDWQTKPLRRVTADLISRDAGQAFSRHFETDSAGRFTLAGVDLTGHVQVFAQVKDSKQQPVRAKVVFTPATYPVTLPEHPGLDPGDYLLPPLTSSQKRLLEDVTLYRQRTARQLAEVVVKAKTTTSVDTRPDDVRRRSLHNQVSSTLLVDQATGAAYANLYVMIAAKIPGINLDFLAGEGAYSVSIGPASKVPTLTNVAADDKSGQQQSGFVIQNPLFLMDGVPIDDTDGKQLLIFPPADVERVELLKTGSLSSMYGTRGSRGVIAFYSRVNRASKAGTGQIRLYDIQGYQPKREFYVPTYEVSQPDTSATPHHREVLYWKPVITTSQGRASFAFPLVSRAKAIRLSIQGITRSGHPVTTTQVITLQK